MKLLRKRRVSAPGCDDAPVVEIECGTHARNVTFVIPYYENPLMLARQVQSWVGYREDLRNHLSVIVIDDGSPDTPAADVLRGKLLPFDLRLFRIGVDVRWNWLAARNLGMFHARDWCLLTDMDHQVPQGTLETLIYGKVEPFTVYRFKRVESIGFQTWADIPPHPNSWFMTQNSFWQIGGYDEALSGHYGTDGEYRRRVAKTLPVRIMTDALVRHEFELDASTTRYKRKQPEDRAVQAMVSSRGPDWRPKVLSFPWQQQILS